MKKHTRSQSVSGILIPPAIPPHFRTAWLSFVKWIESWSLHIERRCIGRAGPSSLPKPVEAHSRRVSEGMSDRVGSLTAVCHLSNELGSLDQLWNAYAGMQCRPLAAGPPGTAIAFQPSVTSPILSRICMSCVPQDLTTFPTSNHVSRDEADQYSRVARLVRFRDSCRAIVTSRSGSLPRFRSERANGNDAIILSTNPC